MTAMEEKFRNTLMEQRTLLNDQFNIIRENIGTEQKVVITYFVPDDRKSGGAYITHSSIVKKVDEYAHKLIVRGGKEIPVEHIREIQGEMFKELHEL